MWIITNFGQFVLFCVEFDMCKGLLDFIVLTFDGRGIRPSMSGPPLSSPAISVDPPRRAGLQSPARRGDSAVDRLAA